MKKSQKNILIVLIIIIIIVICFIYFLPKESNKQNHLLSPLPVETIESSLQVNIKPPSGEIKKEKQVTLNVLDKKYTATINEGDSVYKVMEKLQKNKENNFSFNYQEYPALGIFIGEINGTKGGDGKYWIYSVNGIEASIGVSKYILKNGDIINWELK